MQRKNHIIKVLSVIFFMVIWELLLRPFVAPIDAQPLRTKWEYRFESTSFEKEVIYESDLNKLGAQGWEAFASFGNSILLKRKI